MKRLQRSSLNHKGLSLAELIIALAVIPALLLAAGTFYSHVAKAMQETTDRGNSVTQREQIVNILQRYIANGYQTEEVGATSTLTVHLPENVDNVYMYDSGKLFLDGNQLTFASAKGEGEAEKPLGWITEQVGKPIFNCAADKKSVEINLLFHTIDQDEHDIPVSFEIKLRGGTPA